MVVRRARVEDAAGIARVHVVTWQVAYRGLLPASLLDHLSISGRTQEWQEILTSGDGYTLVCTDGETILGFAGCGKCRDGNLAGQQVGERVGECVGELYAIYLDPAYWGQGYGVALMQAALAFLQAQGYSAVTLWVLEGNVRAIRFYQQVGFAPDGVTTTETLPGGVTVSEVRYRRGF